jgi:hypothetical protein
MSSKNKYDFIVIGAGIEALLKCLELEKKGLSGCIVEKEDSLGGLFRGLRSNEVLFESHIPFMADTPDSRALADQMCASVENLSYETNDIGPLTFHNGQMQPFMGFGETSNPAVDLYSYFLQSKSLRFSQSFNTIALKLREKITSEIFIQSEVTALELEPQVQVTLNGSTLLLAEELYFYDSPLKLSKLLSVSKTALPKNLVPKLSKTVLWTAINLVYRHNRPVTETSAMHVLYGSKELPCLGLFRNESGVPTSQWLCLVSAEAGSDSESLGIDLREMKKQIKRMYPEFYETVDKENILIAPEAYGFVNTQLLENNQFHKVPRLHLGSRYYAGSPNLWGKTAPTANSAELTQSV